MGVNGREWAKMGCNRLGWCKGGRNWAKRGGNVGKHGPKCGGNDSLSGVKNKQTQTVCALNPPPHCVISITHF